MIQRPLATSGFILGIDRTGLHSHNKVCLLECENSGVYRNTELAFKGKISNYDRENLSNMYINNKLVDFLTTIANFMTEDESHGFFEALIVDASDTSLNPSKCCHFSNLKSSKDLFEKLTQKGIKF